MPDTGRLELKDIAVVVPLFATTVAISWEVGISIMSGGFFYFSLSEHLVAAIAALPFALIVAVAMTFLAAFVRNLVGPDGMSPSDLTWACGFGVIAGLVIVGVSVFVPSLFVFTAGVCVAVAALVFGAFNRSSAAVLLLYPTLAAALPFAAGVDLQRLTLATATKYPEEIKLKSGSITGAVAMAGDRGFLLYRPETKTFLFVRADELVSVEYRAPFSKKD